MVRQASVPRTAGLNRRRLLTPPAARNALPAPAPSEAGAGADDHEPVGSKVQAESRVSQSSALIAAHGGEECYRPHPPLTPGPNSRAADTYPGRVGNTQCASSSGRQRWSARTRHPLSAGRPRHHTETPAQCTVSAPSTHPLSRSILDVLAGVRSFPSQILICLQEFSCCGYRRLGG
jgi:hypothetical protein